MNMDFVSMNLVTMMYLVASVCFIQALKGLSHPTTSIRGNVFGMTGMTIAVLTTAALIVKLSGSGVGMSWVLLGLVVGGGAGTLMAQRVEMTKMPELVAFMHSMIGLAAVFIGIAAVAEPCLWHHGSATRIVGGHADCGWHGDHRNRHTPPHSVWQPTRIVLGRRHWCHHLQRFGHCVWQALR